MIKNFAIINYNTPTFVEKLILSINKFVDNTHIFVFDNSDKLPYKPTSNNVDVIDNTDGKIIDFNEFLSKYPKRVYSSGKSNNYASAKHCYTIEKCIETIDDSFMLLDSDVLLKKDVSELFDGKYIYVGETVKQANGKYRVLPYLCFINAKMCKEKNVHFFDDKYMHGLSNGVSDMYDTGGAFYINANGYEHKDIKISDYAIHYGHGSWMKKGYTYLTSADEFLEKNAQYYK